MPTERQQGKKLDPGRVKEIHRMHRLGLTGKKIAERMGLSESTVRKYLREKGES